MSLGLGFANAESEVTRDKRFDIETCPMDEKREKSYANEMVLTLKYILFELSFDPKKEKKKQCSERLRASKITSVVFIQLFRFSLLEALLVVLLRRKM